MECRTARRRTAATAAMAATAILSTKAMARRLLTRTLLLTGLVVSPVVCPLLVVLHHLMCLQAHRTVDAVMQGCPCIPEH